MISPKESRSVPRHNKAKMIHQFPGSEVDLILALKAWYFPKQPSVLLQPYSGSQNKLLGEDSHLHEVTAAIKNLRHHTAPGIDQIANKALINLDDHSLLELTANLNKIWKAGVLPED